jgi:anti-sigma regulatory factor (Ser/Thr protein kinase)
MDADYQPRCEHELTLVPLLTEVRRARRFARYVLQERHVAPERIGTAELLVSELVTNAVQTASGAKLRAPYRTVHDQFRLIRLRLSLIARSVVIEVRDNSDKPPVLQEQSPDSEDGRGLFVVESMSAQWNYFYLSSGGKVVWCELHIACPAAADDLAVPPRPLPRRMRNGRPVWSAMVMNDPQLLRRVRDGLLALDDGEEAAQ